MKDYGLKYKAMFMTVYGGGLRISELCNLRIQDILEQYGKQYKEKHNLPIYVKKTLNAIENAEQQNLEIMKMYATIEGIRKSVIIIVEAGIVQSVRLLQKRNRYIIESSMY